MIELNEFQRIRTLIAHKGLFKIVLSAFLNDPKGQKVFSLDFIDIIKIMEITEIMEVTEITEIGFSFKFSFRFRCKFELFRDLLTLSQFR